MWKVSHHSVPTLSHSAGQVGVSNIADMYLTEKKGYLTLCLTVEGGGKVLLRSSAGVRDWFLALKRCCASSTEQFWSGRGERVQRESASIERWLLGRQPASQPTGR